MSRCSTRVVILLTLGPGLSLAAVIDAIPSTPPVLNGDLGIYSDYIARGLSYTREGMLLAARVEYDSPRGPYLGLIANQTTTIANRESVEIDPFIGFVERIRDLSVDVGAFQWNYPHRRFAVSQNRYNTIEGYLGATYKTIGVKFWYELTDYFGLNSDSAEPNYAVPQNGSSRGSHYLELNLTQPLPRSFTLSLHAGHQSIRHYPQLNFTDWRVGIEETLSYSFLVGVARSNTDADRTVYTDSAGLNLARAKWLGYFKWMFP